LRSRSFCFLVLLGVSLGILFVPISIVLGNSVSSTKGPIVTPYYNLTAIWIQNGVYTNTSFSIHMSWGTIAGWFNASVIKVLHDLRANISWGEVNGTYYADQVDCSRGPYPSYNISIYFPNGTVLENGTKWTCSWNYAKWWFPTIKNVTLPKGTVIVLKAATNPPHASVLLCGGGVANFHSTPITLNGGGNGGGNNGSETETVTWKNITESNATTNPVPVVLPSWSSLWIDNNTIMLRMSISWGTAYKIAVLDQNGNEIPFYASINGWYNGSFAAYNTPTTKALTIWRANITYNGATYEGLVIEAGGSPINLLLEPYPNEWYDYAIFLHLEGKWSRATPVITTSAIPQGGVFDWLTGAFRWFHDALMGTPLKPVVQAFDTLGGIAWGLYNIGKTILSVVWGIIVFGAKIIPYLSIGILLAFAVMLITRPIDTIEMIISMIDWIKKTIGAIAEFIASIA